MLMVVPTTRASVVKAGAGKAGGLKNKVSQGSNFAGKAVALHLFSNFPPMLSIVFFTMLFVVRQKLVSFKLRVGTLLSPLIGSPL
jgi:hypothetical protein